MTDAHVAEIHARLAVEAEDHAAIKKRLGELVHDLDNLRSVFNLFIEQELRLNSDPVWLAKHIVDLLEAARLKSGQLIVPHDEKRLEITKDDLQATLSYMDKAWHQIEAWLKAMSPAPA